jgi:hypothetical protein
MRLATLVLCALTGAAQAEEPLAIKDYVIEPDGVVAGHPMADYANLWWQWAYSIPDAENPVVDTTGVKCHVGQAGPVWFLAGGFDTAKISRSCTIPAGQHIFFPVINMVAYPPDGAQGDCEMIKAEAAENNSQYVFIRVNLDGSELKDAERFRVASTSCFDLLGMVPPEYGAPQVFPSATDGYWIMLKPLPRGKHHLEFKAAYTNPDESYGGMVQNIAYELTVE